MARVQRYVELSKTKPRRALAAAGWFEGRRVDVSEHVRLLIQEGYSPGEAVREFISEFEGLHLKCGESELEFSTEKAVATTYRETVSRYEDRVQRTLTVVGVASGSHLVVMIDDSRRLWFGYDDFLSVAEGYGVAAIVAFLEGRCEQLPFKDRRCR